MENTFNAHEKFFASVVGPHNIITDGQKTDWGKDYTKKYTPNPLIIVLPETTEQVAECLKYCNTNRLSVVPSGGRTGLSAGAVAAHQEVVISTSRMRKIYEINKTERTLHCQAGVVTKEVQGAAHDNDLYFPVDFASSGSSQIGGNIATNAGGIKVIRYGLMRQWVQGLKVVLADGTILDLMNATIKNNTGYDLRQLFIGSEGTLGIITETLVRLTAPPAELLVALFASENLENVTKLFELACATKLNLTAYEFFADSALKRVQEHTKLNSPFSGRHPFYVLVEVEKSHESEAALLEKFVEQAFEKGLVSDGVLSQNSQQSTQFWGLRENISESITALTVAHKNDISLPLSKITPFVTDLQKLIADKYPGFEVVLFGHIGDGNLHVNFIKPETMAKDEFFAYAQKADVAMFELVKKYGGSISAEHGIGMTKKDFIGYTRSPEELHMMKLIKKSFDPNGIMNPGKVL